MSLQTTTRQQIPTGLIRDIVSIHHPTGLSSILTIIIAGIVSRSSAITTKDLKIIHAEILIKIVQGKIHNISQDTSVLILCSWNITKPPKAGRTLGGTEESTRFVSIPFSKSILILINL